jgi:hypothetical protein
MEPLKPSEWINPNGLGYLDNPGLDPPLQLTSGQFRSSTEPHDLHWKASKCILRYVQGTMSYKIHYAAGCALDLISVTDSDWVGDSTDRKSMSGYTLNLGSGPICWSSKKQSTIALSSTEVEYK